MGDTRSRLETVESTQDFPLDISRRRYVLERTPPELASDVVDRASSSPAAPPSSDTSTASSPRRSASPATSPTTHGMRRYGRRHRPRPPRADQKLMPEGEWPVASEGLDVRQLECRRHDDGGWPSFGRWTPFSSGAWTTFDSYQE